MIVPAGLSRPSLSAASINRTATRSLIDPPGLNSSTFATICVLMSGAMRESRTSGVSPIVSRIDSLMSVVVVSRVGDWAMGTTIRSEVMPGSGERRASAQQPREPALQGARHGVADRALLEALDQLGHETLDDQARRRRLGEATRAQVEELLAVDLGDRGGVRAAHVVGEDLEAGDRVGV